MSPPEPDLPVADLGALLAAIVESSDDAIFTKDLNGTVLSWNRGAERLYGYRAEEIVGHSVSVLVPEDRADEVARILASVRAGETVDHFETVRIRKDGTLVPVSLTVSPLHDADGRIVAASKTARDITERKQLVEDMERYAGILSATSEAFVGMDAEGIVTEWNPAAEGLLGWHAGEAIGRRLSETIIPERYRDAHEQGLRRYVETGDGPIIGQRVELAALHRDGREFPIQLSVFVTSTRGERRFNAFVHDLSGHRRLTAELEAARDQALEASRQKSDFLATMSHEIRTPMNGVIGMTGLLLDTELDPEQREYAEIIRGSAESLLSIINDILDFSKVEAGRLDLETVDVDLHTLVAEVADLLAPRAHAKGLELATLVRPDVPPAVRGDPGRLRQILLNLLSNAVKFTDAGEVVVRATASEPTDDDHAAVHFEVSDTGIGIHPADRDRLFNPFAQADTSTTRTHGGTGLGLAISRRLVELLGGELTVDSEPGRGSTFQFTVALKVTDAPPATIPRADLSGLRVLIVDDNATNRRILEEQIRSWRMVSTSADGGAAALAHLRHSVESGTPFDVAVIDMEMPDMDGIEMTRTIRGDPSIAALPVVMLTSAGVRGSGDEARRAGVSAYLTKPARQSQLFDVITAVLGTTDTADDAPVDDATIANRRPAAPTAVLVAEDNPVNQKVAAAMLAKMGYRADVVANGAEAVEAVSRIAYGAVLMDCQMPEMDGYTAASVIRSRERGEARLPIIAMTAMAMEGEEQRCLAAGMDDYISKPVDRDRLASVLDHWIRGNDTNARPATVADRNTEQVDPPDRMATLRQLMANQPGGFAGLLTRCVEEVDRSLAAVRAALVAGEIQTVQRELHTMVGTASTVGADRLARACRQAEMQLETGSNGLDETMTAIEAEIRRFENWVGTQVGE